MKEIESKVQDFIQREQLIEKHDQLLIAVSGGIDSIVMLYMLARMAEKLEIPLPVVAHVNHKLRGKESDRDEQFVKSIADELGLTFVSENFDIKVLSQREKKSIQETARKYRLRFLEEIAKKLSCNKIATGHNQDDLAETTIMWISRGSGLKGASGIMPKRGKFIRPLLVCSRHEIARYAENKGIIHVEDSSNSKLDYIRNIIRKEVLPLVETRCYPGAKRNIARFSELIRVDMDYLEDKAADLTRNLTTLSNSNLEISIEINDLMELHPALRGRIIRHMVNEVYGSLENLSYHHVEKILELCAEREGGLRKLCIPGGIEAVRTYTQLIIRPHVEKAEEIDDREREFTVQYPGTTSIESLGIRLDISLMPGGEAVERYKFDDPYVAFISFDKVTLPLKIRFPRRGDTFVPLGSTGTKKLSDYFIDEKIASDERWNIPILTDSENIVWIIGHRLSELYRINFSCKNVLMIKVTWL
ncbi:MAG: tRNA lysidine(34) synthetase TilS [Proteobacteria bacterium]|nr:tRNA lysidine(34) synthetase TilS [Pseudomonadota bacterium]